MPSLDRIAREVLVANGFQPDADEAVGRELAGLHEASAKGDDIKDLRALKWSSIDNTTSRDLDQIEVADEEQDGAIVLRIGIADVDALVPKGSAIDAHAAANATSVYTGVKVYPMLPEALSTDLTSLNEGEDRLVLVIEAELTSDGTVRRHDVYRALATNHAKLDYESVGPWLEGHGPEPEKLVPDDALEAQLWLQDRAASLLKRVRDFAAVGKHARVDARIADAALNRLEVDAKGLDGFDRRYLSLIAENFGGGPVGIETIAAALGEARDAIEEIVEPYLMQQGLVQRTPRGRVLAGAAYGHLGLSAPPTAAVQTGLFAGDDDE